MPKGKPPEEAGAGAAAAFLLTAPNRKASFFPKENVGAAVSFSADKDPKVEPAGVVVVAKLPNKDAPVVIVMVDVLLFDSVVDGAGLSFFS